MKADGLNIKLKQYNVVRRSSTQYTLKYRVYIQSKKLRIWEGDVRIKEGSFFLSR